MNKLEEHEQELKVVTTNLEEIQSKIAVLRQEEEVLIAGKKAWEAIVAMERRQYPTTTVEPSIVVDGVETTKASSISDDMENFRDYDDAEEEGRASPSESGLGRRASPVGSGEYEVVR